jgi:cysteine synthase A
MREAILNHPEASEDLHNSIGNTPLLHLPHFSREAGCTLLAKGEFLNASGSVKDRIALFMIEEAERRGDLKRGSVILEVTSGNTGIALAMVGVAKGYRVVLMMPRSVSVERRKMIASYGAELRLIDHLLHMQDAVREAVELAREDPDLFLPLQFSNPDNPEAHYLGTGREILRQVQGKIDAFVMGIGTGGTLMGVARALREAHPDVRIVAVEPAESAVLSGGKPGSHGIQGLADGFVPEIVDRTKIDRVVAVCTDDAIAMAKRIVREEGHFVGISSGANVWAALQVGRELGPDKTVVTVLPDRGERYLSVW